MKYKIYKQLSQEQREEWMFNHLNDRIKSPKLLVTFIYFSIYFIHGIVLIIFLFILTQYDYMKYSGHIEDIRLLASTFSIQGILIIGIVFIELFNLFYRGWKEYKLVKSVKKNE